MSPATLAIVIPSLNRASALEPLLDNIRETTPPDSCTPFFVLDHADWDSRDTVNDLGCRYWLTDGTFPVKTNAGGRATTEPLILSAGDDVTFNAGWFDAVLEAFEDQSVQVAGGPDLTPMTRERDHVTMPIVRRSYLDDPGGAFGETGTIFHEGYHHNFSETELWQLACHRGVAKFVEGCVIVHHHPTFGTAEIDDTYRKGGLANSDQDRQTFERRKAAWLA